MLAAKKRLTSSQTGKNRSQMRLVKIAQIGIYFFAGIIFSGTQNIGLIHTVGKKMM